MKTDKINLPNLLLIAGTGRNTGKTILASSIIEQFSTDFRITGLKISPHFHSGTDSLDVIYKNKNFNIYRETSVTSSKDSSRMLKAGAQKVFYIECFDEYMQSAFEKFLQMPDIAGPIICESPALRKYINPGVFLIVDSQSNQSKKKDVLKMRSIADLFIETDKESFAPIIKQLTIHENSWVFPKQHIQD